MLRPKLFDTLKSYTRKQFFADLMAGSIVGIVALPLAIAFAIASGVTPERGLYTAIIAGFIISVLGGSRVQIGGPTGAFVVIIYGIVQQYGVDGLLIATMMAGIMLIAMGLFRLGSVIKFIPYPVVVGFTTGIAVIIFSSQMADLLGLKIHALPADFIEKWIVIGSHLGATDLYSLALALGVIFITVFWGKVTTKIPGPFVAIVLSSVAVVWLQLPVETIGTRFGEIPSSLPLPHLPHIQWGMIKQLIQPAITIALLAGIEALLSAVVADGMISGKHRSNMELVAQGTANLFSPLFGGIPATGAIARTATNIKNGGRTPIAGIFHSVILLAIMLLFGKWAVHIPMAGLAGIMVVVAYNMSEWHSFRALAHGRRSDAAVLLVTFGLTVIIDLTFALQVGILIAGILFLRSMTSSANVTAITKSMDEDGDMDDLSSFAMSPIPDGVKVYEISGPMFFGAAYKFKEALAVVDKPPRVIIIRMRNVPVIDATGERALEDVFAMFRKRGTEFVISGLQAQARTTLTVAGLIDKIGEDNIQPTFDDALLRARALLQKPAHKGANS
jgi:SulP family sulfate permease